MIYILSHFNFLILLVFVKTLQGSTTILWHFLAAIEISIAIVHYILIIQTGFFFSLLFSIFFSLFLFVSTIALSPISVFASAILSNIPGCKKLPPTSWVQRFPASHLGLGITDVTLDNGSSCCTRCNWSFVYFEVGFGCLRGSVRLNSYTRSIFSSVWWSLVNSTGGVCAW